MFNHFLDAYRVNYTNFYSRARRAEYWSFVLFFYLGLILAVILDETLSFNSNGYGMITLVFFLMSAIPFFALRVRRLHDTGKSGWWLLINLIPFIGSIVIFIFMLLDSDPGSNQWGENPKEEYDYYEADESDITSIGEDL